MKIVFLDAKSIGDDIDLSGFDQLGEVVKYGFSTPEEAGERTKDADVVIINKVQINEQTIGRADHLKLVCVTATGTNNLDKEYLAERQIEWRNVAGYSTETVAQHTFALLFYLLEKLNYYDQYVKSEKYIGDTIFTHFSNVFHDLNGMTWGIVGLGNIGDAYRGTRHNAGFHFVDEVADKYAARFQTDRKFFGEVAKARIGGAEVILLKPSTLMNLSGKSVAAVSTFHKISPSEILVAHDELDLLPGTVRLKISGGSAGHNGLKSIVSCLGSSDFARLRIGIGHPRDRQLQIPVADYVLSRPPKEDLELISSAIEKALACIDEIVDGDFSRAMSALNEKTDSRK